jgi:ribosomal protein L34
MLKTRESGFRHRWSSKKLAKWNASRAFHAEVMVTYQRGGTDVSLRMTTRAGRVVVDTAVVAGQFWPSVWFDFFRSRWEGAEFVVLSRVGKESLRRRAPPDVALESG